MKGEDEHTDQMGFSSFCFVRRSAKGVLKGPLLDSYHS